MKSKRSNKIKRAAPLLRMPVRPLDRLRSRMDVFQLTAADEILAASAMRAGLPVTRDPDLDVPMPARPHAADERQALRTDLTRTAARWRADLKDSLALAVVDEVLFHERALVDIDAANRWRKGTARAHLSTALKHFAALRGNAPRGVNWRYVDNLHKCC